MVPSAVSRRGTTPPRPDGLGSPPNLGGESLVLDISLLKRIEFLKNYESTHNLSLNNTMGFDSMCLMEEIR